MMDDPCFARCAFPKRVVGPRPAHCFRCDVRRILSPSFLSCIPRIATRDYEPSDNDILRARIRTLGVQEYSLTFESDGTCRSVPQLPPVLGLCM